MSGRAMHPVFIGLCGPSGCGKSTLANNVVRLLGEEVVAVLSLDSFYKDLSALPPEERETADFDRPEALDGERLREVIETLGNGGEAPLPVYDFATHTRLADGVAFPPRPVIFIEGIFVFSFPWLLPRLSSRIYLDLDPETCLAWRIARDKKERGRGEEEVRARFERDVLPAMKSRVEPQKAFATRVLEAWRPSEELVREVLREIARIPGVQSRIVPRPGS